MVSVVSQEGLGELLGSAFGGGIAQLPKSIGAVRESRAKKKAELDKRYQTLKDRALKDVSSKLKFRDESLFDDPESRNAIADSYKRILDEALQSGYEIDPDVAFDMAMAQYQGAKGATDGRGRTASEDLKELVTVGGWLGQLLGIEQPPLDPERDLVKGLGGIGLESLNRGTETVLKETPGAAAKFLEDMLFARHPGIGATPRDLIGHKPMGELNSRERPTLPSDLLANLSRRGLQPEQSQKAEETRDVLSNLMPFLLEGVAAKFGPLMETLGRKKPPLPTAAPAGSAASEVERAVQQQAQEILVPTPKGPKPTVPEGPASASKTPLEDAESKFAKEASASPSPKPLAGRVSPETPTPATAARVDRMGAKPFQEKAEVDLLKRQLKDYPKYEAEILADREAMLASPHRQEPTAMGKLTKQGRMQLAEKEVPAVQKLYQNAIARTRALEDTLATASSAEKQRIQTLLDISKKELNEAELLYKRTLNNAKTGERQASTETHRSAARNKIQEIQDKIAKGEEIELKKADYNPERVKKANQLSKRKPITGKKSDDFHTQVHNEYGNVYRQRLGEIDKEISALAKDKGMSSLSRRQQLGKERDVIKKLAEHADADVTIHRNKLALREMFERQKAAARFKELKPKTNGQKVKDVFKSRMDAQKAGEGALNSKESAGKAAEDLGSQAAKDSPKQAEQIAKETEAVKETIKEQVGQKPSQETKSAFSEALKQTTEAKAKEQTKIAAGKLVKDWEEFMGAVKGKGPNIFKTKYGQSFLIGMAADSLQNAVFEVSGWKPPKTILTHAVATGMGIYGAAQVGPSGAARGGVAGLGAFVSSLFWKHVVRKQRYGSALRKGGAVYSETKKKYGPTESKEFLKYHTSGR